MTYIFTCKRIYISHEGYHHVQVYHEYCILVISNQYPEICMQTGRGGVEGKVMDHFDSFILSCKDQVQ